MHMKSMKNQSNIFWIDLGGIYNITMVALYHKFNDKVYIIYKTEHTSTTNESYYIQSYS